ncbi:hypothetical protein ALC60_14229, partial [Trachymyrmex zeteki]
DVVAILHKVGSLHAASPRVRRTWLLSSHSNALDGLKDPLGQQWENTFTITLAGIKPGLRSDRVYIFYVQFAKGNGLPLWAL